MIMTDKDAEEHYKMLKEIKEERRSDTVFCIGNGESRICLLYTSPSPRD